MPTYDYRCPNGHDFEHFFRKMSEAQATLACPVCGAVAERRVSGGAGLVFKGSGFYITDYGKDGKKQERAAATEAARKNADKPAATGSDAGGGTGSPAPASRTEQPAAGPKSEAPAPAPKPKPNTGE